MNIKNFFLLSCILMILVGCSKPDKVVNEKVDILDEIKKDIEETSSNIEEHKADMDEIKAYVNGIKTDINKIEEETETVSETKIPEKSDYIDKSGGIAGYLSYNYQGRWMYISGLKVFEEFEMKNQAGAAIIEDENAIRFDIYEILGIGVDGSYVYFKMNLTTKEIYDVKNQPAPNFIELGMTEYANHSEEVITLSEERMVEIGEYFYDLILEIESNQ